MKWISVKDEMPNINEVVFAIIKGSDSLHVFELVDADGIDDNGESGVFDVWANCYGNIDGSSEWDDDYDVTHWQPLPKLLGKKERRLNEKNNS